MERFLGTFRQILEKILTANKSQRWIDYYQLIANNVNNTKHKSTGFKPSEINESNYQDAWNNLYSKVSQMKVKKPKYKPGDLVRISVHKLTFEKGSTKTFSDEIFEIHQVQKTIPVVSYRLKTLNKPELLQGSFLEPELSQVQIPK